MKHYLDLVSISNKVHRRQSRMTRICIVLAVFLAGCNASAVSFDTPSDVTSGEVITESVVHDFNEKPDQQTQYVASHPVGTTVRYDLNGDR